MSQARIELIQWVRVGYELGKCWEAFVDDFLPGDALIRVHVLSRLQVALESLDTENPVVTGAIRDLRLAMASWEMADSIENQAEISLYQTGQHLRGVHAHLAGYSVGSPANSAFSFGFELGRSILFVEHVTSLEPEQSTTGSTPSLLFPRSLPVDRRFWQVRDIERLGHYSQRIAILLPDRMGGLHVNELLRDDIPDITNWECVYPYHRLGWHYADIHLSNLENPPTTNAPQEVIEAPPESTPAIPTQTGANQNRSNQPIPAETRRIESLRLTITAEGTVTRDMPDGSPLCCDFDIENQPWKLFAIFLTAPDFTVSLDWLTTIWATRRLGASSPSPGTVRQAISALRGEIESLRLEIVPVVGSYTLRVKNGN